MTYEIDHTTCDPSAHDFTFESQGGHPDDDQSHVGRWIICNDCNAPLFYCRNAEWYFHAAGNFYQECFLSGSALVPVPAMNDDEIVEMLLLSIRVAQNRGYLRTEARQLADLDENWLGDFFAIFLPDSVGGNTENDHVLALCAKADERGFLPNNPEA